MRPVFQTDLSPENGNCFQACVASIFELELDQVPHFVKNTEGIEWWWEFHNWLWFRRYSAVVFYIHDENREKWYEWFSKMGCYGIGTIKSGKLDHAVVVKGSRIVHNPWPSYCGKNDEDLTDVVLIVAEDPSKMTTQHK